MQTAQETENFLETATAEFSSLDWDDIGAIHHANTTILRRLATPRILGSMVRSMAASAALIEMSEQFVSFTKLVLLDDIQSGVRVRLHLFSDAMAEEAHNHRNSFTTHVLRGHYTHILYGNVSQPGVLDAPQPRLVYEQHADHGYTIHHEFVHSTYAVPNTASLVLQGPRMRKDFQIKNLKTGATRTRVGHLAAQGAIQESGESKLDRAAILQILDDLIRWRLAL